MWEWHLLGCQHDPQVLLQNDGAHHDGFHTMDTLASGLRAKAAAVEGLEVGCGAKGAPAGFPAILTTDFCCSEAMIVTKTTEVCQDVSCQNVFWMESATQFLLFSIGFQIFGRLATH